MKKLLLTFAGLLVMANTQAAVLNFDDIASRTSVERHYGGADFTWSTRFLVGDTGISGYGSAYSGKQFAVNRSGTKSPMQITHATGFNFDGAYFAKRNIKSGAASAVEINAYDLADKMIGSATVKLTTTMMYYAANFKNVARLALKVDGWFAMDDFTYSRSVSEVPVPAAAMLFGPALLGFLGLRRKANKA